MAKFKAAAVHAAPVFMNKKATIEKVIDYIHQAKEQDIELLVFPEVFVPGYPSFTVAYPPLKYLETILEYAEQSVAVFEPDSVKGGRPKISKDLSPVMEACKRTGINVVLGVSERLSSSAQTLFNSQLFISGTGELLGVHRKLVPTYSERSVWAYGGGATLRCWNAPLRGNHGDISYRIGGLCCGENLNYGAKLALVNDGQQLHAASWPGQCGLGGMEESWTEIKLLAQSHSLCAFCFTVCASSILSEEELKWTADKFGRKTELLKPGSGWSGVVDPNGKVLAEDAGGVEERMVVAEIDLDAIGPAKLMNDPAGHYARPEVLKLNVNRTAIWEDDEAVAGLYR